MWTGPKKLSSRVELGTHASLWMEVTWVFQFILRLNPCLKSWVRPGLAWKRYTWAAVSDTAWWWCCFWKEQTHIFFFFFFKGTFTRCRFATLDLVQIFVSPLKSMGKNLNVPYIYSWTIPLSTIDSMLSVVPSKAGIGYMNIPKITPNIGWVWAAGTPS